MAGSWIAIHGMMCKSSNERASEIVRIFYGGQDYERALRGAVDE
jgi:hypothetical protein